METIEKPALDTSKRKSWREKMRLRMQPRIVTNMSAKWKEKFGGGRMLIATPDLVDRLIRQVPRGKLVTVNILREKLSSDFQTDYACPVTTGIFTWIVAHAAEESRKNHDRNISPYWRVIKEDGRLNPKYPGGQGRHADLLRKEGFRIKATKNGKHLMVENFRDYLFFFNESRLT